MRLGRSLQRTGDILDKAVALLVRRWAWFLPLNLLALVPATVAFWKASAAWLRYYGDDPRIMTYPIFARGEIAAMQVATIQADDASLVSSKVVHAMLFLVSAIVISRWAFIDYGRNRPQPERSRGVFGFTQVSIASFLIGASLILASPTIVQFLYDLADRMFGDPDSSTALTVRALDSVIFATWYMASIAIATMLVAMAAAFNNRTSIAELMSALFRFVAGRLGQIFLVVAVLSTLFWACEALKWADATVLALTRTPALDSVLYLARFGLFFSYVAAVCIAYVADGFWGSKEPLREAGPTGSSAATQP